MSGRDSHDTMRPPCAPSCEEIVDILPEPFMVIGRDYRIVATNAAYRRRYGVGAEEVVGRRCHEVSHRSPVPCSQNGEHCPLEEVLRTGEPFQVIHTHFDARGRRERVQLQAVPIRDAEGRVAYIGEYIHPLEERLPADDLLVGRSAAMLQLVSLLQRVAPTRTTVLLLGESGVGKEQAAKYVHRYSARADGPFVVVDCGTLGDNLIESELFGHEKGAFTGATSAKKGLFEVAEGGTLFIDEVCELPLPLQTKLLRVLETGMVRRVGGTQYRHVDVRVIAATNRDVQAMVAEGRFREDLYYRLSAFPVEVPPLRERKDDIPALAAHFLARREDGEALLPLRPEVIRRLLEHDWPGNVRELRNVMERAAILAAGGEIRPEHLVFEAPAPAAPAAPFPARGGARRLTREAVLRALAQTNGHRAEAARRLGVSERTVYRYLRRMRAGG